MTTPFKSTRRAGAFLSGAARASTLLIAALLLASDARAQAQDPATLLGRWRLDNARSNGVGPGVRVSMTITGDARALFFESRYVIPQGPVVLSDTMTLDSKESDYTYRRPNGQEGRGRRTVKPIVGLTGLEIVDSVLLDTPQGPAPRWTEQKWTVDAAAGTLTQEITLRQPFVVTPIKNVYVRESR